ncbi:DnaA/Hda family protein [Halobacteriovorax sp. GB3]|uniref:DnaA/Hda family protein n=1 Tax=Halobacteriovorax sp. GB3 TaxID=2719615 RepID=UPI00235DD16C|nr:DnaA/Hda family protein [Halobacteriovorax sp. GB3]MDD0853421.1 DnaA/Hda family protein [Halobacteriovorax sp. GB3]
MGKTKAVGIRKSDVKQVKTEMVQLDLLSYISETVVPTIVGEKKRKVVRKKYPRTSKVNPSAQMDRFCGLVDHSKTFNSFCLGESNRLACHAVRQFLTEGKCEYGVVYIMAMSGLGKSHLLHAAGNELMQQGKSFYISSIDLILDHFKSINELLSYDVLLIDDFDEITLGEKQQSMLCRLIDYAKMGEIKVIICANHLPKHISNVCDKLKARLSSTLIHKIDRLDRKLSRQIVEDKCERLDMVISDDAKDLVADSFDFHVYGLESALYKLKSFYDVYGEPITLETALNELKSLGRVLDRNDNCQKIISRVARDFAIDRDLLTSPMRKKSVTFARHVAMYILKEKNGLNVMRIAEVFNRDHSSVIYGIAKMKQEVQKNPQLLKRIHKLI